MKYIFVFMIAFSAWGRPVYKIGSELIAFEVVNGIEVNADCKSGKCLALIAGKKYGATKVDAYGKTVRSVRCTDLMKGKVLIGHDRKGNDLSFCSFPDGSFLR